MQHNFKESVAPKCPAGHVLRKAYTTKRGTYVPARCIVERGIFPQEKITKEDIEEKKKVNRELEELCRKEDCPKTCPKGQILRNGYRRSAYTRENGTFVEATLVAPECIKGQGAPGKGPKLITFNPVDHILSDHGYIHVKDMTEKQRHDALLKVIRAVGHDFGKRQSLIYVIKALTARATVTKKTSPESSKAFKDDQKWASELLKEWKEKHKDEEKEKKKMRLIMLGPTDHILSAHGYHNISGLRVTQRHKILLVVLKDLAYMKGDAEAYQTLIKELVARSNLGMTKSPESSKLMKEDADWVSGLYEEWKEKYGKKTGKMTLKNNKSNGKLKLAEDNKKKGVKLVLKTPRKSALIEKIEKLTT